MKTSTRSELFDLSIAERLQLVEDLWDSIATNSAGIPLTEEQRQELDERLTRLKRDPRLGDSWNKVKSRISRPK